MRLVDMPNNGPACRFGDAHIYYALYIIGKEETISRASLADMLKMGEGSIRRLVEVLRRWEMIVVRRIGISLSDYGRNFMEEFPMRMVNVKWSEYVIGAYQKSVMVFDVADKITNGMYQRDRGIIAGANGASVFLMRDGRIIMPKSWDMDTKDPDFSKEIRNTGIKENDVVIISGASDPIVAATSVIAIGLDLL
jgi:hypothetical protein